MSQNNHTITKGETGTLLDLTIGDKGGPIDITGHVVVFRYAVTGVVTEKSLTPDPDQTNNKGRAYAYWTVVELAAIPIGTYPVRVKATSPDTKVRFFPTHGFGELVVRDP